MLRLKLANSAIHREKDEWYVYKIKPGNDQTLSRPTMPGNPCVLCYSLHHFLILNL